MQRPDTVSLGQARRIALGAQGFDRPRPPRVSARQLRDTIRRLGLLQLDFVNVLVPSHYLVPFSRLGPYERPRLHRLIYRTGEFTEQWAHEASVVPIETWPLLEHRRQTHRLRPYGFETFLEQHAGYAASVLEEVRARGPLIAADLHHPKGTERRLEHSWFGTVPRATLEAHFGRGQLAVAERRGDFTRVYDLAERVIPPMHHGRRVAREEAQRELLLVAARAQGIATAADLADYWRMPVAQARPRLAELVEARELQEVTVEGWRIPAYRHPGATEPRRIDRAALLSPFDPVVWFRPRAARLFDFDYRFEIFVPRDQRRWGAYVLPFLWAETLAARVDVKADREERRLVVAGAWRQAQAEEGPVAEALAAELRTLAAWLDLESVAVGRRGNLARPLAAALRPRGPRAARRAAR